MFFSLLVEGAVVRGDGAKDWVSMDTLLLS